MGRGIFSGLIWGGITGGLVVSVLSLYAPLPAERSASLRPVDDPDAPRETAGVEVTEATPIIDDVAATDTTDTDATDIVDEATVEIDTVEVTPEADDEGAADVASAEAAPTTTEPAAVAAIVAEAATETPLEAAPAVQARAPQTAEIGVTQRVAQAPASDSAVPGRASPLLQGNTASADGGLLLDDDAPRAPNRTAEVTRAPSAPAIAETTAALLSSAASLIPTAPAPGGLAAPLAEATPEADLQTAVRVVDGEADLAAAETPNVTPVSSDTPIKLPVPNIENPVSNVVTNRLPSVATPEAGTASEAPDAVVLDANEVGALRAYAAPFDVPASAGIFSLILIDVGAKGMPRDELLQLELPFSIAIDPSAAGAAANAKAYRDAGIEVLVIANDLPETAAPSDVAVALGGYFDVLDQSIAVLDPVDGRIQNNRDLLQPVLGAIRDTGHGLVTYDRGLNTAQQAARREGIASATVFRLLDAELEEAPRIKRYLSRAAFTASKDGAVVVVGHSYPETVTAMLEWALDEKTAELSVVPVSQVMLRDGG